MTQALSDKIFRQTQEERDAGKAELSDKINSMTKDERIESARVIWNLAAELKYIRHGICEDDAAEDQ